MVVLTNVGAHREAVRQVLCEMTGLTTWRAETLLSEHPAIIGRDLSQRGAESIKRALEAQGAVVYIVEV